MLRVFLTFSPPNPRKPLRMLRAIKGLIGAPQNNFKLTKNGRIVYEETREKCMLNRVLKEIFQRDQQNKERLVVGLELLFLKQFDDFFYCCCSQTKNHFYEPDKGNFAEGLLGE